MSDDFRFDAIVKDPDESRPVELDLFGDCANFWRANEQFSLAEFIRPERATGYAYECTVPGTSAARAPSFPTTIGAIVPDGSVTWTCRAAGANGLNPISSPAAVSEPTGLTIASVSVSESTKILAAYGGGTAGQAFDAKFSFTLNGVPRVARQKVQIRLR